MIVLLLLAQAATAPVSPATKAMSAPTTSSWSIKAPDPTECVPADKAKSEDIVVCGRATPVPFDELASDPPRPVNRDMTGAGALAAQGTPCAARNGGCYVGMDYFKMGTALVRLVQKVVAPSSCCEAPGEGTNIGLLGKDVVGGVGKAFRKKPDKGNRVAISLEDVPVDTATKIKP